MYEAWRTVRGVVRSLRIYYGHRERRAAMDRLYGRFIEPGDLVFDVGAHVGDRVAAFRRLGARVVAVEPPTASDAFVRAADGAPGWQGQAWTRTIRVAITTLDALIARHGLPTFIKIDVEGFEAEALAGLTRPPRALSFEFTTIQREVGIASIERCAALGYARYNAMLGESHALVLADWVSAAAITDWLQALPPEANSGDVYALRV